MLPPVSATFRPRADHQSPAPSAAVQPSPSTGNSNTAAPETEIRANTLPGGRLDILSLAGQLSIARGLSVLAETIGKLLKIDRQEGEPLADYAQRLAEAIRALSPADRAALERSLNQIVKGISLRLLAEILKNPAGPEAAQLSLRMELAQFLGRDLAARAVASSYRQNAGTTLLLGSPARSPSPSQPPAAGSTVTSATTPGPAANAAGEPRPHRAGAATPLDAGATRGEKSLSQPQRIFSGTSTGGEVGVPGRRPMETSFPTRPVQGAGQAAPPRIGGAQPETAEAPTHSNETNSPGRASGNAAAGMTGEQRIPGNASAGARPSLPSSPVPYDAPALIRMSQRPVEPEQARRSQPVSYDPERLALAALTEWLTEAFSGDGEARPLRAGALPPQANSIDIPEAQAQAATLPDEEPTGRANRNPTVGESTFDPVRTPARLAEGTHAAKTGLPLPPELIAQQGAMLLPPAAAAIREGLALPYVAYPPAAEEPEAEEPKARQVDRTDEDGEQQSSGQGSFNGRDEEAGQEETGEGADDPSAQEADAAAQAQDYYLRMAGWS